MNILLGVIETITIFSSVVIFEKLFNKEGLYVWVAIATVLANILVCKSVDVLGYTSALGNVLFASNFLATDILHEKYTVEDSKKVVNTGLMTSVAFLVITQLSLLFTPSVYDIAQESMETLFDISVRTSIAGIVMYYISNVFNIWLYETLKKKYNAKLWVRNNISTILANCGENYLFAFLAFYGVLDIPTIISIATTGTIIEMILGVCDTPFLYIALKRKSYISNG